MRVGPLATRLQIFRGVVRLEVPHNADPVREGTHIEHRDIYAEACDVAVADLGRSRNLSPRSAVGLAGAARARWNGCWYQRSRRSRPVGQRRKPICRSANAGVLWTNSTVPLFAQKRPSDKVLAPTRCGTGHELTPDNLTLAERGTRWRCRQCGIDRAAAWRPRHYTAA